MPGVCNFIFVLSLLQSPLLPLPSFFSPSLLLLLSLSVSFAVQQTNMWLKITLFLLLLISLWLIRRFYSQLVDWLGLDGSGQSHSHVWLAVVKLFDLGSLSWDGCPCSQWPLLRQQADLGFVSWWSWHSKRGQIQTCKQLLSHCLGHIC